MVTRSTHARLIGLCLTLLMVGCAAVDPYARPTAPGTSSVPSSDLPASSAPNPGTAASGNGAAAPDSGTPGTETPALAPVAPQPGPAAAHLLAQASTLVEQGEFDRAAAQVERALRIERSSPWLYLALAEIRVAQGDLAQAAALGRRARALSQGDPAVLDAVFALPQAGAGGTPR